jgi:hypothetical protein
MTRTTPPEADVSARVLDLRRSVVPLKPARKPKTAPEPEGSA